MASAEVQAALRLTPHPSNPPRRYPSTPPPLPDRTRYVRTVQARFRVALQGVSLPPPRSMQDIAHP